MKATAMLYMRGATIIAAMMKTNPPIIIEEIFMT
jgi:hypothetical protein